jgi:SAM-dependent methyltransferase
MRQSGVASAAPTCFERQRETLPRLVSTADSAPPVAPYDDIAEWYADCIRAGSAIHEVVIPCLRRLAGPVAGLRVLDLGCGEGIASRAFAAAGARVVGVDISRRLLDLARAAERRSPQDIRYVLGDAERLSQLSDGSFEGAVSSLALADVCDLRAAVQALARVLRPGGWFVFAINHPCGPVSAGDGRLAHAARDYFEEGFWRTPNPSSVRGRVGAYHRPLSSYLNALLAAGFVLERSLEPPATEAVARLARGYERVPVVLAMRWRRPEV